MTRNDEKPFFRFLFLSFRGFSVFLPPCLTSRHCSAAISSRACSSTRDTSTMLMPFSKGNWCVLSRRRHWRASAANMISRPSGPITSLPRRCRCTDMRTCSHKFSHQVVSYSLWPHELQHARLLCPSLSLWVCSNSCVLCQRCHQQHLPKYSCLRASLVA